MSASDAAQASALRHARRRATGLLAAVAVGFLASFALPEGTATGFVRAALEAGLVGGLADWFAVVALFRHPLGIPIPHTAVIPRSKDGLGANMASFVRDNFVGEGQVRERLADPAHLTRLGTWLADRGNAQRLARQVAGLAATMLDTVDQDRLVNRATIAVRKRLREVPVSRLAGESLEQAIAERRHTELVTATIDGLLETLGTNRKALRRRLGQQSPAWVPVAVDDLVFDRAEQVVHTFLRQLAEDDEHELRKALDDQLLAITLKLQHDEASAARIEEQVQQVISERMVAQWVAAWWAELREAIRIAADEHAPESPLRQTVTDALVGLGERLCGDHDLRARAIATLEATAPRIAELGQDEIGTLIENTIERWDAEDTSRRLELWMGRDLQFVRINGTVVGALVGLVLHTIDIVLG